MSNRLRDPDPFDAEALREIQAAVAMAKDARAENECFEAGHPLVGHACACGLVRFAKEDQ